MCPSSARFKLQVGISMVGTCQINSESEQAHSTTSWQFFDQDQSGKVLVKACDMHCKRRLDDFDFNSQKKHRQNRQTLKKYVAAQGTGWVNAVLICDDFPELGTNLISALASQARGMCICIRMPHVRNWREDTWGMSEKEGTRVHKTESHAPRKETKRLSYKHITRYLTSGLPGRARAHAWLLRLGKLKPKAQALKMLEGYPKMTTSAQLQYDFGNTTQQASTGIAVQGP